MRTVFFRMALVLAFVGVFASCTDAQPVSQSDSRFYGVFYHHGADDSYGFWKFDGTSRAVHFVRSIHGEWAQIFKFNISENGMAGQRDWYGCYLRHITVGPHAFSFNNEGTELRMGILIGPDNVFWRTYARNNENFNVALVPCEIMWQLKQPVPLSDRRFNGMFVHQSNGAISYWVFDGTSRVQHTVNRPGTVIPAMILGDTYLPEYVISPVNTTVVYEFRIYENGMIRHRRWVDQFEYWSDDPVVISVLGQVANGPYQFLFNEDGSEFRIGWKIGSGEISWRTYTKR